MDLEKLEKLHELKEKGILSEEEFEKEKQKILNDTKKETKLNNKNLSGTNDNSSDSCNDFSHLGIIKGSFCAFISSFKRWNDFKGRSSRFDFWGANFFIFLLNILFTVSSIVAISKGETGEKISVAIELLSTILICWLSLTLNIRRLHDVNKSGWWILTLVVPAIVIFFKGDAETNRFGSAFKTNEKKATIIICLQILLLFLSMLLSGFLAGYSSANNRFKVQKSIDQIQTMAVNIHTLFAHHYNGIEKPNVMYAVGIYTDEMCENEKCENPKNPFGGTIKLKQIEYNYDNSFSIVYNGIPKISCIEIATFNWWGNDNLPSTIRFNNQDVTDIVTQNIRSQHPGAAFVGTTPEDYMGIMKQLAPVACSSDNNTIEWIYK